MADQVVTILTTLPPEDVLVRAVQFFTTENWRAQSQTNRIATFVGRPKVPIFLFFLTGVGFVFFVIPGVLAYLFLLRNAMRLQNIVVTTSLKDGTCEVVVTFSPHARKLVERFSTALPQMK